ncbi:hypothetical protein AMTRI_Chr05g65550 [Amborella trichopoda]|uniref:Uncharacterized protein n=1 Tax=Amborella trichopoda TaxID=13333 RepID=W1P773_AMBTC|nr:hypothetical protein AMTR_s00078p00077310 [Amborella trichopoda]
METQHKRLGVSRAVNSFQFDLPLVIISAVGLTLFGYNASLAASRAGNRPWINIFFIITFLDMALLDCLLMLHSSMPEAFEKWASLKRTILACVVTLTLAFLLYLWISLPPSMGWLVWVALGITLSSGSAMVFLSKSLSQESH